MVVLLYNTGSCCHCNEFKGVFDTKELALNSLKEEVKKSDDKNTNYSEMYEVVECNDNSYDYKVVCKTKYAKGNVRERCIRRDVMATYVCSDIHGRIDKFKSMLEGINFSKEDELYIIGDVIDGQKGSLDIIEYIRENDNIHYLRGNHEQLMLSYFSGLFDGYGDSWMENPWFENRGLSTYNELNEKVALYGEVYKTDLLDYLSKLPVVIVLDTYVLVHGGFRLREKEVTLSDALNTNRVIDILEDRSFVRANRRLKDYTVICGHTSVQHFGEDKIMHTDGKILIDCGCANKGDKYKLGCLRLDDLEEFYF